MIIINSEERKLSFMTFQEAVNYIENIPKFTKKTTLENTEYLLKLLEFQESQFQIFHIAGTNGKGSVCACLSSIIQKTGRKVGLFTSPHLIDIRERMRIDGEIVDEKLFTEAFQTIYDRSRQMAADGYCHPAYFEFLFGMAIYIFIKRNVEVIILETGLGGRLDATNVIKKPAVTIITSISLDHTEILGDTIEQIAYEKAGIIKENVPVIYWAEDRRAKEIIEQTAAEKRADTYPIYEKSYKILEIKNKSIDFCVLCGYYENRNFSIPFCAKYQAANGMLAISAIAVWDKKREITYAVLQDGLRQVSWKGRMEEILPDVYLDGAHNEAGIKAFIEAASEIKEIQNKKKYLLFSAVKEKEYKKMARLLCEGIDLEGIILTEIDGGRKVSAAVLAQEFLMNKQINVEICSDEKTAFQKGMEYKGRDGILFCVGSLYLVGNIEAMVIKN